MMPSTDGQQVCFIPIILSCVFHFIFRNKLGKLLARGHVVVLHIIRFNYTAGFLIQFNVQQRDSFTIGSLQCIAITVKSPLTTYKKFSIC